MTVKFQQRELETASDWDTLVPGTTAEYAWDEPMSAHRLRVVLESATEAFRDAAVQEYNLDDIKVSCTQACHTCQLLQQRQDTLPTLLLCFHS